MNVQTSNRLTDLSARIRQAQDRAKVASVEAVEQSIEAGQLLIEAKAECRHGDWLPFLEMTGVSERQAQRLMKLARSGLKPDAVSDLGGVTAALASLAEKKVAEPDDDIWRWAEDRTNGPLSVSDLEMGWRWFAAKLMRLAGVDMLTVFAITVGDEFCLPTERLLADDDIKSSFSLMAEVANGEREIPFEASARISEMRTLSTWANLMPQILAARFYVEAQRRSKIDYANYDHEREFDKIHKRLMAKLNAKAADLEDCLAKELELAKRDGPEAAAAWMAGQCDRIRQGKAAA